MARKKEQVKIRITDAKQLEDVLMEYASADARMEEINAKIEQDIIKAREKFADELQELNTKHQDCFDQIKGFAEENADKFTGKRSMTLTHGTIGFHTGMPQVKALTRAFKAENILALAIRLMPGYVRVKREIDKAKIIADREKIDVKKLSKCGMQIMQEETFFIEPKKEKVTEAK